MGSRDDRFTWHEGDVEWESIPDSSTNAKNARPSSAAPEDSQSLPKSVRYVKNGRRGEWWPTARAEGQIHLGWGEIPASMLTNPGDFSDIAAKITGAYGRTGAALGNDLTQLRNVLDNPSKHFWITFEKGELWWCTVKDGITVNPDSNDKMRGHFWLCCVRVWSNKSLNGKRLARADLPGSVERVAGFKGTVCKPREEQAILRLIRGEVNPLAAEADCTRHAYEASVEKMIAELRWPDFEQLIDLILARTGWARVSKRGGYQEGFDIEAENLTSDEIAWVQVKSEASQSELNKYIDDFSKRDRYARGIFAVHNPKEGLTTAPPSASLGDWSSISVGCAPRPRGMGRAQIGLRSSSVD
jgi:hypothetical protein